MFEFSGATAPRSKPSVTVTGAASASVVAVFTVASFISSLRHLHASSIVSLTLVDSATGSPVGQRLRQWSSGAAQILLSPQ